MAPVCVNLISMFFAFVSAGLSRLPLLFDNSTIRKFLIVASIEESNFVKELRRKNHSGMFEIFRDRILTQSLQSVLVGCAC